MKYANNMQEICKKYPGNMLNMHKICMKYARNMQRNMQRICNKYA